LSKRHLQRAIPTAHITGAADAADAGYLDEVVPQSELLDTAVARAIEFAALDPKAYRGTLRKLRGDTLATMASEVAADRAAGAIPTV
jgi:enoyl-CoA hydratase